MSLLPQSQFMLACFCRVAVVPSFRRSFLAPCCRMDAHLAKPGAPRSRTRSRGRRRASSKRVSAVAWPRHYDHRVLGRDDLFSLIASFLPGMKAMNPLWTLGRLRQMARFACILSFRSMPRRLLRYYSKESEHPVNQKAVRIRDSGFLWQCWLPKPWAANKERTVLHRKRLIIGPIGLPAGVTQEYFDKKTEKGPNIFGWVDGRFYL